MSEAVLYSCVEDEGRPLGIGVQAQVSNQSELCCRNEVTL
jgi:hypothetical protein